MFGALFYAIVQGGLILIGVQGYWVNILFGMVLILSVLLNRVMVQVMLTRPEQLEEDLPPPGGDAAGHAASAAGAAP